MTKLTRRAGWARPMRSSRHHFFKENDTISICGKWMLFGDDREPDTFESPDDCKACRKKLNAEKDKQQ